MNTQTKLKPVWFGLFPILYELWEQQFAKSQLSLCDRLWTEFL